MFKPPIVTVIDPELELVTAPAPASEPNAMGKPLRSNVAPDATVTALLELTPFCKAEPECASVYRRRAGAGGCDPKRRGSGSCPG